ncbi:CsxC family protein [Niallia oryzisoli]|uniref:CsxC family protein n=1 Tax=Niallia oryzisoli TaxID=1737571 RepID=UPI003736CD70
MSNNNKHNHKDDFEQKHYRPQISIGKVLTKMPVVLAEPSLQVHTIHRTRFPEDVLEIKDVKKQLVLTQCRLLLPTNKLFIKGYVRKNIQYAAVTEQSAASTAVSSNIQSHTEHIPFNLITEIKDYIVKPEMPKTNNRHEFDFYVTRPLPVGYPEKDELLSSDLSQFHQASSEYYNELPYCELVSSKIIEWVEAVDRCLLESTGLMNEGTFTETEDKLVIDFSIKILQNQHVYVSSTTNDDDCDCE